ncbi:MAG: autotransporter outer membrane beta-barrel domain-containing protein [Planctomycetaceae bacterium]|jgi:hypothetical protein|nr:autotransporter outer membrane beta-barrel domain-containing protein [Planctomycetaceae bacterium]
MPLRYFLWVAIFLCASKLLAAEYGNTYFSYFAKEYFETESVQPVPSDWIVRGQSRQKQGGSYRLWADFFRYGGTLSPHNDFVRDADVNGSGLNVGFGFPKNQKSLSFFYTYASPEQTLTTISEKRKINTANHLFGVMADRQLGLLQFYGLADAGFDKYKFNSGGSSWDADSWQMNFYGELAAEIPVSQWNIRPHLGLGYHYLDISDGFTSGDSFHSNIGLRVLRNCWGKSLVFQGRVSWIHQYLAVDPIYQIRYNSQVAVMTPTQYDFSGLPGRDWIWCGLGLKYYLLNPLSLSVDYDLNANKYQTIHIGSLSARFVW